MIPLAGLSGAAPDIAQYGWALVAVAFITGIFGFGGPWWLQRGATAQRNRERAEDKADREAVAARAQEVALQAVEAAKRVSDTADLLVESNNKVAQAAIEANDHTQGTLKEIKTTGEHTLTIVNSEKSRMVVRLAKQARLIARLMPDDNEAQLIAAEAEKEEASLSQLARQLPGGGEVDIDSQQ
jgi:hypothetical protein